MSCVPTQIFKIYPIYFSISFSLGDLADFFISQASNPKSIFNTFFNTSTRARETVKSCGRRKNGKITNKFHTGFSCILIKKILVRIINIENIGALDVICRYILSLHHGAVYFILLYFLKVFLTSQNCL